VCERTSLGTTSRSAPLGTEQPSQAAKEYDCRQGVRLHDPSVAPRDESGRRSDTRADMRLIGGSWFRERRPEERIGRLPALRRRRRSSGTLREGVAPGVAPAFATGGAPPAAQLCRVRDRSVAWKGSEAGRRRGPVAALLREEQHRPVASPEDDEMVRIGAADGYRSARAGASTLLLGAHPGDRVGRRPLRSFANVPRAPSLWAMPPLRARSEEVERSVD
jgi:hypothetical protein